MTDPLWTAEALAAATGAALAGTPRPITGASIDTRTLAPGDLFFAIRGEARDGHDFVRDALDRGAAAAVVAPDRAEALAGAGPLVVASPGEGDAVLAAMTALGRAARARSSARIAAVTGSVGKTSTKEMLRHALAADAPTHASVASYNNHWGVPLTLARMPADAAYGVFEVGMNHPGEIAPLSRTIRPHAAVVTTVEPVHLEHFRALTGIADAKGEVFAGLEPGGTAILNRDAPAQGSAPDSLYERLRAHALASMAGRIVTFGEHAEADVRAERIVLRPDVTVVDARVGGVPLTYQVGLPGRHNALNSLAVVAVAAALGADLARVALALGGARPPAGRGERTVLRLGAGEAYLLDESYNANPASMRAALATLAAVPLPARARRIAVLGDMLELGAESEDHHRGLAAPIDAAGIDLVFTAGRLMPALWGALPQARRAYQAARSADLVEPLLAALRPGDAVMVKGSNSVRMAEVVAALKARYGAAPTAAARTD